MGKDVHVQELPGIGKKFDLPCADPGKRLAVIAHRDGSKELYAFDGDSEDPSTVIALDEKQGRILGAVLTNTYFTDD
jgi:K+/H+ antiporter YhaU regulatory subunit KhtT